MHAKPVQKTIGGVTFTDPYAYMHADTPDVLAWQWEEADSARNHVRAFPGFDALRAECTSEFQSPIMTLPVLRNGGWFTTRLAANGLGHELVVASSFEGAEERVFCAPEALGGAASAPAYVYKATPSPDGAYVVVTVLPGGALDSKTMLVRVADGFVFDVRLEVLVFLGFAEPCWMPDSRGFVLGDRAPDRRHRVRRVRIDGDVCSVSDHSFSFEEVSADIPVLTHHVSPGGRWSIGVSAPHERTACILGNLETDVWTAALPSGFHGECHGDWLDDETYVAIASDQAQRGEVVAIPIAQSTTRSAWRTILPESEAVLRTVTVRQSRLILSDFVDVSLRLRMLSLAGEEVWRAPLPAYGASPLAFPPRTVPASDEFLFAHTTFTETATVYRLDPLAQTLSVMAPARGALAGVSVEQFFATAKDGVRIPYFVVRNDEAVGPRPAMLRAYGGFNLAFTPNYLGEVTPFVRCGGVFIHANIRGGGEYGSAWHNAGRLHNKQTSFDDCYAVAEDAISRGLTEPRMLAAQGASNGGLLAGVVAVQRPDLFCATVPQAPLLDMMEPVRPQAGEDAERTRTVFLEDYGDPSDPDDAKVLFKYSPYHNIKDGVAYPAMFQIFGEYDLGCPPYHGRKFTARLRAASTSANPVLFRTWRAGGHGGSNDPNENGATNAEMMAFIFERTGLAFTPSRERRASPTSPPPSARNT